MTKLLKNRSWTVQSGKGGSWEVASVPSQTVSTSASFACQWDRHRVAPSHTASYAVCFTAHVLRDALKFCSGRHITATMAGRPAPTKVRGCGLASSGFQVTTCYTIGQYFCCNRCSAHCCTSHMLCTPAANRTRSGGDSRIQLYSPDHTACAVTQRLQVADGMLVFKYRSPPLPSLTGASEH